MTTDKPEQAEWNSGAVSNTDQPTWYGDNRPMPVRPNYQATIRSAEGASIVVIDGKLLDLIDPEKHSPKTMQQIHLKVRLAKQAQHGGRPRVWDTLGKLYEASGWDQTALSKLRAGYLAENRDAPALERFNRSMSRYKKRRTKTP
jgi:hypothetical protein